MTYRLATIYVCIWPSSFSPVRISPIGLPQHKNRNLNKLTLTKRMLYKKRNSQEMTFSDYNGCNYFTIKSKAQFFLIPFFSRSVGSTFEANTQTVTDPTVEVHRETSGELDKLSSLLHAPTTIPKTVPQMICSQRTFTRRRPWVGSHINLRVLVHLSVPVSQPDPDLNLPPSTCV